MVSGTAQRIALNKTALGAAMFLENWSRRLKAEMKKQGIDRRTKLTYLASTTKRQILFGIAPHTTDDKEPVTFERGQIRELLDQMAALAAELRRFEKPKMRTSNSDD